MSRKKKLQPTPTPPRTRKVLVGAIMAHVAGPMWLARDMKSFTLHKSDRWEGDLGDAEAWVLQAHADQMRLGLWPQVSYFHTTHYYREEEIVDA